MTAPGLCRCCPHAAAELRRLFEEVVSDRLRAFETEMLVLGDGLDIDTLDAVLAAARAACEAEIEGAFCVSLFLCSLGRAACFAEAVW